jgi:hexosaminidase
MGLMTRSRLRTTVRPRLAPRTRAVARIAALLLVLAQPLAAQGGVIPLPAETVLGVGSFSIGPATTVRVPGGDRGAAAAARYLAELWSRTNHLTLPVTAGTPSIDTSSGGSITFRHRRGFGPEGYGLEVTPRRITVSSSSAAGLFYGAVTLWQLLPPGADTGQIPVQTIRDAPEYAWRGLMLDSARHFQSPAFIRSMIDWMAWHKLNVLHWHLTDDQGWRLEIRKYPRLTSVGAWRIEPSGARYGGFYTQDEVRGIVRFAAARHVQIIPEIDLPGHATAAIAAYPALGARDATLRVSSSWGVHTHLFNLEPQTFRFLEDVLAEVIQLFPSPIIHIGGDEVVNDEWSASPAVQARAQRLGLHDPGSVQFYFTHTIERYVRSRGRRIAGWDEILRPGLDKSAIVMSWHGVTGAHAAAIAGNDTVLAPDPVLYFDHRQSTLPTEPPGRLDVISLEKVYRFEPHDESLSNIQRHHVLGIQANLWTEHMQSEARVQWMALPRAAAVAEVSWSGPQQRDWPDFLQRLVPMFARYRALGLNYADSAFAPAAQISRSTDGFSVILSNQTQGATGEIRYTLDGSDPSAESARYVSPLAAAFGAELRAAAFVGTEQASRSWALRLDAHTDRRRNSHDLEQCSDRIGLLLEPGALTGSGAANPPLAIDIMNPCWIDRAVDLSSGPRIVAAVAPLPFNYEIGADTAKIRVGDARTPAGELEVHIDGCDQPAIATLPLAAAAGNTGVTTLAAQQLPAVPGRHDVCLRFARPQLDPQWALDWIEIGE